MKLFKIYTEEKNVEKIIELLDVSFLGYSLIHATGSWKGVRESSVIIEILTSDKLLVETVAERIKKFNNQESILILVFNPESGSKFI